MTIGYLRNPYEKEKDDLVLLYEKSIGKKVEVGVRNMGRIKGTLQSIVNYHLVIPDLNGKTSPTIINIKDISIFNPLD